MTHAMPVETSPTRANLARARWLPLLFLLAGGVLSLGFPNDLVPGVLGDRPPAWVAWLALLPFWWAALRLPPRAALWATWAFAAGFGISTVSWMRLFTLLPWVLLALLLSLLPPLAYLITTRMRLPRILFPLGIALAWAGLEWLRGQGTFGFPWAELGASQVDGFTAAIAAVGGLPLITFLMLWGTGSVVLAVLERGRARWVAGGAVLAVGAAILRIVADGAGGGALGGYDADATRHRGAAQRTTRVDPRRAGHPPLRRGTPPPARCPAHPLHPGGVRRLPHPGVGAVAAHLAGNRHPRRTV